jgi:hypothetical protein
MRRLALVVPLLLLAGCGSGAGQTETVVVATETVLHTVTASAPQAALDGDTFKLPSGNIGCTLSENVLVCDILSGLDPEPSAPCELDWTGIELEAAGPASPRCAGDTSFDQAFPVLGYGRMWKNGAFNCSSATSGLTCENGDGHGFSLARAAWETH